MAITAEQRTDALLKFFGWQGGTIHQLAEATGCKVEKLLHHSLELTNSLQPYVRVGYDTARKCELNKRLAVAARHKAEYENLPELWDFWSGVILGNANI